jgi:hypothetical protein
MSLTETLARLGGRLGVLRVPTLASSTETGPKKLPTRTVTLADLTSEIKAQEVKALAELPAELSVSFERMFDAAGIVTPARGWTLERLRQLLQTAPYQTMDRPAAQKAILEQLAKDGVAVEDLVKDAMARDQAIDAFAVFARQKMKDRIAARQHEAGQVAAQLRALQDRAAKLAHDTATDQEAWRQWQEKKVAYEKDMAHAISYVLDRPVITIDPAGGETL